MRFHYSLQNIFQIRLPRLDEPQHNKPLKLPVDNRLKLISPICENLFLLIYTSKILNGKKLIHTSGVSMDVLVQKYMKILFFFWFIQPEVESSTVLRQGRKWNLWETKHTNQRQQLLLTPAFKREHYRFHHCRTNYLHIPQIGSAWLTGEIYCYHL